MKKTGNKAIAIDHDQVRSVYLATGSLKEAAKSFGLKPETVRKWAQREEWETAATLAKLEKRKQAIIETKRENGHQDVPTVCHASDALVSLLDRKKGETQFALAIATANAAVAASELDGLSALDASRKLSDLSAVMGRLWPDKQDQAVLSVNVLGLSLDSISNIKPAIDI